MAITAASLVATVSMEGATAAQEQLAQLGSSASQAQSRLSQMQQGEGEASTSLGGRFVGAVKDGVSGLLNFGSKIGWAYQGFKTLADGAIGVGHVLLDSNASLEQTNVAFTSLLGSSKAAGDYLQQLQQFAAATPFEFPQVTEAAQHFIAFGFAAKDVIPTLTDIGDAMAGLGQGGDAVNHVVEIFGQMHAAGKLNAQDMMQLTSMGIPAWQYLADAMHKSIPEVQKLTSNGLIPANVAIADLRDGMHKAFGGDMQKQSQTFLGLLSTFQDNARMAWTAFTGPLFEAAKNGLVVLGNLVSSKAFQDFATNTGKQVAAVFGQIGQFIQSNVIPAFQGLIPVFQAVMGYLKSDQFAGVIADFQTLGNQVLRFVGNIGMLAGALAQSAFYNLGPLLTGVIIPAFDAVAFKVGEVMTFINDYLSSDAFAGFVADAQTVLNQLVQIFISLAGVIGSLPIDSFVDGFLGTVGPLITGVVLPALDTLMFDLGQFLTWLQQTGPLQDVVKAGLIGIGAAFLAIKIGAFIATIPALVAGFIAWAGAAWTAAAGTIAATWPLLAIGAVIAIVVAGIVLAVQHWGDITKWFQGVWGAFTGWLSGTLHAIGGFFSSVWAGILAGLQTAWNAIVTVVKIGAQLLFLAIFGPIIAIVNLFKWLYDHNYYFKDLVDTIVSIFHNAGKWIQDIWNEIVGWVSAKWNLLRSMAEYVWNYIQYIIQQKMNEAQRAIVTIFGPLVEWMNAKWNQLRYMAEYVWNYIQYIIQQKIQQAQAIVQSVINTIVGFFAGIWGRISGPLGDLWNNVTGWFNNLLGKAFSWGSNLIDGFIKGIRSMIGNAGQAASDVINSVTSFLGFHSPAKQGEGRYVVEWGRGMIEGFNQGVLRAIPQLQTTVNMAVTAGTAPMRPTAAVPAPFLAQSRQPAPQIIVQSPPIYIDGKLLTNNLLPHIASAIRYGTGVR